MQMEQIDLQNGEARVKTDGLTVQEQVKRAYADAHNIDNGYDHEQRCLSFLTSRWVAPGMAANLAAFIGPYNAFDPDTVVEKLSTLTDEADVEFTVAVGREGSPVLYFATEEPNKIRQVFESYADEFGEVEAPDISGKERYRDDDYPVDPHSSCRHDEPPVSFGHEADGNPDGSLTYLRAWWD